MNRFLTASATATLALMMATPGMADVKSGLQIGDSAGVYHVQDCTGPAKGQKICYR